jgi:hypothetical protein
MKKVNFKCKNYKVPLCDYCSPSNDADGVCIMGKINLELKYVNSEIDFISMIEMYKNHNTLNNIINYLPAFLEKHYPQYSKIYNDIDKYLLLL